MYTLKKIDVRASENVKAWVVVDVGIMQVSIFHPRPLLLVECPTGTCESMYVYPVVRAGCQETQDQAWSATKLEGDLGPPLVHL